MFNEQLIDQGIGCDVYLPTHIVTDNDNENLYISEKLKNLQRADPFIMKLKENLVKKCNSAFANIL